MELIWENPFYPHLHKIQSQNKHFIFLQADEEYLNEDIVSTLTYMYRFDFFVECGIIYRINYTV